MYVFYININTEMYYWRFIPSLHGSQTEYTEAGTGRELYEGSPCPAGCSFHVNTYRHANYSSERNVLPPCMTYLMYTYFLSYNECDETDGFNQRQKLYIRTCLFDDSRCAFII